MSPMSWERPENRVHSNVPIETREYIAREYPGESVGWVLRGISRPTRVRRRDVLCLLLVRFGLKTLSLNPKSKDRDSV
jgi:hypothetical protein